MVTSLLLYLFCYLTFSCYNFYFILWFSWYLKLCTLDLAPIEVCKNFCIPFHVIKESLYWNATQLRRRSFLSAEQGEFFGRVHPWWDIRVTEIVSLRELRLKFRAVEIPLPNHNPIPRTKFSRNSNQLLLPYIDAVANSSVVSNLQKNSSPMFTPDAKCFQL